MRNLKTALLFIFLATLASESFAQTFGVKAGLNLSTSLVKDDDETYSDDLDMKPGFHVGVTAEFPINEMFSFQPEVLLTTKGYKQSSETTILGETYKFESSTNPIYIDIPLLLKANFDANGTKIFGALGPYVGFGIAGKYKYETTSMGNTTNEDEDIEWGDDEEKSDLKQFDAGVSIGVGATINVIQFGVAYDFGLANISPNTGNGFKANNRVFRVSVGYVFGGDNTE